jgi:hypothetical protein
LFIDNIALDKVQARVATGKRPATTSLTKSSRETIQPMCVDGRCIVLSTAVGQTADLPALVID